MNKFMLLMIMTFFLILITITANSLLLETSETITGGIEPATGNTFTSIWNMMKTFYKIITFQVEGFPVIFNLLIFMPITFGVVYIIIDILKDLVPFT